MDVDAGSDDGIPAVSRIKVETLVHEYLKAQQLEVLAENGMGRAVDSFVEKDDTNAIKECVPRSPAISG
jgi:double-strand break repair protein MRE11